jgi:hypothetical protein
MTSEFSGRRYEFQGHGKQKVIGEFDGGTITSDAGALLLRELEKRSQTLKKFSECFTDYRDARYIEHTVEELIGQRVYAIILGYEDLNDHDELRLDPFLATLVGKPDPTGNSRKQASDQGKAMAGKSTLNRLELFSDDPVKNGRYKKISANADAIDKLFVQHFLHQYQQKGEPQWIVLDLDVTDDLIYGHQEGRFYHGYYKGYCYLPLYIFCSDYLLCARLREANVDASAGSLNEIIRICAQIRESWPQVKIVFRADSSFAREEIMAWCESQPDIYYLFGLAKNSRLVAEIKQELEQAKAEYESTNSAARVYKDFTYSTLDSWSCTRRVVGKAEHLEKGSNPRFIVTSLPSSLIEAKSLYEDHYCARGDMENRIKEQKIDLFSDRTSTQMMKSNQLRLYFSSCAYLILNQFRHTALKDTQLASAHCQTIRLKLLKIGAKVTLSLRTIRISLSSSYPYQLLFSQAFANLTFLWPSPWPT